MNRKIEISPKTIVFVVVFLLLLKILWMIRELLFALFFAFIFMSALKPAVYFLERHRFPRFLASFLTSLGSFFLFLLLISFILPPLVNESLLFIKNIPNLLNEAFPRFSESLNVDSFSKYFPNITNNFFNIATNIFSNFIFIISVTVFTFYFLLEEKFIKKFLDRFLIERDSERILEIIDKAEKSMGDWVRGELILMLVIGLMSYIGLSILGIKYALPLAIIAGILEIIPYIGPIISAIPAAIIGFSYSSITGISVLALYVFIQQLENSVIVPFVMKRAVGLSPVVVLIVLTIGGKVAGVMGAMLSIPLTLFIETILIGFLKVKNK